MLPLDELNRLDSQVEGADDVSALKSIYERLGELARENAADFDFQLAVAEVRKHVVDKGFALKHPETNGSFLETALAKPHTAPAVPRPAKPLNLRRALMIGAGLGVAAWLIIFVILVQIARNRNMPDTPRTVMTAAAKPAPGTVPVEFVTTPPGASIRINGESKCNSNCRVNLPPGNYQITALLDGYDPGATGVTVVPGNLINVSLKLVSQTQAVRVLTDLEGGRVLLDGKPAGDLVDGQLVLDRVPNGRHSLRVIGKIAEAGFTFEGASGKLPLVTSALNGNNVMAVVVTNMGNHAKILTNSPKPIKVALNGKEQGEAGTQGLELKGVSQGDQTLLLGDGPEQKKLALTFGVSPILTAYLKSDITTGTLVVSTGEDDVTVYLNGKEYARKTKRGELRVLSVGSVYVRVAKFGFQPEPEQHVEVKKGEETRVAFTLKSLPRFAAVQFRNAVPGTQISIDDKINGRIAADGTWTAANLNPGDHAIEIRREGFVPRRILRTLRAGETLSLNGADLALPAATGSVHLEVSPKDAVINYHRSDESQTHVATDPLLKLTPGNYVFTIHAPNYLERTERLYVSGGETRNLEIALVPDRRVADELAAKTAKPAPTSSNWSGWSKDGSEYVRTGGNRVVVRTGQLQGTITFTARLKKAGGIFHSGKLRWFVQNGDNYSQFEVDKKKFQAKSPEGSRSRELGRDRDRDEAEERTYSFQIEITPDRIIHRMKSAAGWVTVDAQPARANSDGQFGFVIPGSDQIAISDFHYTPK